MKILTLKDCENLANKLFNSKDFQHVDLGIQYENHRPILDGYIHIGGEWSHYYQEWIHDGELIEWRIEFAKPNPHLDLVDVWIGDIENDPFMRVKYPFCLWQESNIVATPIVAAAFVLWRKMK